MSNCLKRNIGFLRFLEEAKNGNQIQAVLKSATPSQVQAISEICNHVICGYCKLDKKSRDILRKKIPELKKVASTKKTYGNKKRIISQTGGGLLKVVPILIKAVLPSLIDSLDDLF
tara:strand:+ start:407 stop:754 length:348 start_codon:yes stop_codon:yes gene_type:complete